MEKGKKGYDGEDNFLKPAMEKNDPLRLAAGAHDLFIRKRLTLSVAESCTGGLISHLITSIPGASVFFDAGAVTYSSVSKMRMLGVSERVLATFGAVSAETAAEMATKVRALLGTDFSLSTTGNLGPDVLEGKEKGLVYIGVASRAGVEVKTLHLKGERLENKEKTVYMALEFLLDAAGR